MEYPLLPLFTILTLAVVATHAALPPELYWKSVLPTTPMPKAITDVLFPDWVEDKSTNMGVGKGSDTNVNIDGKGGGVSVRTSHKGKPETVTVGSYAPFRYTYSPFRYRRYGATESQLQNDPNAVGSYAPFRPFRYRGYGATESQLQNEPNAVGSYAPFRLFRYRGYGATESQLQNDPNTVGSYAPFRYRGYGATESQLQNEPNAVGSYAPFRPFRYRGYGATESQLQNDPNTVGSYAPFRPFRYRGYGATESQLQNDPNTVGSYAPFRLFRYRGYGATESQLHNHPNVALFFLEKDLRPGTKLDLHFIRSSNSATFLPRQVADTIPFSSKKLEDVFNKLSVRPGSEEARIMKTTIEECEETGIKGEEISCATSLESMVDFSTSKLGKNVEVVSTMVDKEEEIQKYTMTSGIKKLGAADKAVVCHKQNYPYAVFYCHKTEEATRAYFVPLEGANGIRVKAVVVCHMDTSEWNPKHLAFQVLKIKPGTLPVCHILPEDHVVWVPK